MAVVRLTTGELVLKKEPSMTDEQAVADANDRNEQAEALNIKARYVVTEE